MVKGSGLTRRAHSSPDHRACCRADHLLASKARQGESTVRSLLHVAG